MTSAGLDRFVRGKKTSGPEPVRSSSLVLGPTQKADLAGLWRSGQIYDSPDELNGSLCAKHVQHEIKAQYQNQTVHTASLIVFSKTTV